MIQLPYLKRVVKEVKAAPQSVTHTKLNIVVIK